MILSKEDFVRSKPTKTMKKATTSPDMYSILAWPKGCSLAAGRPDSLKPMRVTKLLVASDRLLTPSARIETLLNSQPAMILAALKRALQQMPTMPAILP